MGIVSLVGEDTVIINDRPIQSHFADGEVVTLEFPDDLVQKTTGKDGNTVFALNSAGTGFTLTFSVLRGGWVDKFLNGLLSEQKRDFVGFTLINGVFTKRLGDGTGKVTYDTYNCRGMMFSKIPNATANVSGDNEQAKIQYVLTGVEAPRALV